MGTVENASSSLRLLMCVVIQECRGSLLLTLVLSLYQFVSHVMYKYEFVFLITEKVVV